MNKTFLCGVALLAWSASNLAMADAAQRLTEMQMSQVWGGTGNGNGNGNHGNANGNGNLGNNNGNSNHGSNNGNLGRSDNRGNGKTGNNHGNGTRGDQGAAVNGAAIAGEAFSQSGAGLAGSVVVLPNLPGLTGLPSLSGLPSAIGGLSGPSSTIR